MAGDTEVQQRHTTSLAVWDVPAAVATGETFTVKAGVKSSAGVALGGACVELCDGAGAVVAQGLLEDEPWPDSEALCWTEIALKAPAEPGTLSLTARFDGHANEPHEPASAGLSVNIVARAEHTLTVTVAADGTPLADAVVRLGPYREPTDASGIAKIRLARGRYELVVWRTGYAMTATPVAVEGRRRDCGRD